MSDVVHLLTAIEQGDPHAADQLLPLVYGELRRLAAAKLAHEHPGQTLQPTALVHEAYLRLVGDRQNASWDGRGHFFAAAAEAMRRILVEAARRKRRRKHGGAVHRVELADPPEPDAHDTLLAFAEALTRLGVEDPLAARVVELRYFHRCRPRSDCSGPGPDRLPSSTEMDLCPRLAARGPGRVIFPLAFDSTPPKRRIDK